MKILMRVCIACLISALFVGNVQAQMETANIKPITMSIVQADSHCFDVIATALTTSEEIIIYGTGGISFNSSNVITAQNTTTCQGRICFEGTSPADYITGRTIHCAIMEEEEVLYKDGCVIVIGPG